MDLGLTDRTFLVTGGSRGLGRATAEVLVAEGANVVLSARSAEAVDRATAALGERSRGIVADNAAADTPVRLIDAAREAFGRVDGALISVGGPPPGTVSGAREEDWRAAFDSVFLGTLRLANAVADQLDGGGSIAFVLSTSVKSPIPNLGISNGLRPGLAMAAKSLADELGPRNIRVNGLLPGRIDTDRIREMEAGSDDPEALRRAAGASIPLGRYGEPAEFGRIAAFVLSPASSYLTGAMVPVDGGALRGL